MQIIINGKYKLCSKLGQGSFGILCQGYNLKTNEEVAIKLERLMTEQPMLHYEALLYKKLQGQQGFSNLHWTGVEGDFNVMVMDIQGPSLQNLFEFCEYKFDIKTILWIGSQMIQRIEAMHATDYIHRDIKPENFLIGSGKKLNTLYIIDFGLSKRFKDPKTGQHIRFQMRPTMTGTMRYCSHNAHQCCEQSRRDDLEAIGNILIYFLMHGELPWM